MSNRLNQDRQKLLEPQRMISCKKSLTNLGFEVTQADPIRLEFIFKGSKITFFPYSGWHSGKTIEDGRGFSHLLQQLKK